jgi:hypothetical protein
MFRGLIVFCPALWLIRILGPAFGVVWWSIKGAASGMYSAAWLAAIK